MIISKIQEKREEIYGKADFKKLSIKIMDNGKRIWLGFVHSSFDIHLDGISATVKFNSYESYLQSYKIEIGSFDCKTQLPISNDDCGAIIFDILQLPLKFHNNHYPDYWSKEKLGYQMIACGYTGWLPDWTNKKIACYGPDWKNIAPNGQKFTVLYGDKTLSGQIGTIYFQNDYSLGWLLLRRNGDMLYVNQDIAVEGQLNPNHKDEQWMFYQAETKSQQPRLMSGNEGNRFVKLHDSLQGCFPTMLNAITAASKLGNAMAQTDTWDDSNKFIRQTFRSRVCT